MNKTNSKEMSHYVRHDGSSCVEKIEEIIGGKAADNFLPFNNQIVIPSEAHVVCVVEESTC